MISKDIFIEMKKASEIKEKSTSKNGE